MKAKTWTVRACSLLLAAAIGLTTAAAAAADGVLRSAQARSGGTIHYLADEDIAPGIRYTEEDHVGYGGAGSGAAGPRRVRMNHLEIDPSAGGVRIISAKAQDTVNAMETIGGQAERAVLKGNNVVAVVNADPYDMDYGINTGIMVQDGCIVDSQPNTAHTTDTPVFFVREDGTAQIDSLRTAGEIAVGGGYVRQVTLINRNNFGNEFGDGAKSTETLRIYTSAITRNHVLTHNGYTVAGDQAYALIRLEDYDGAIRAGQTYSGSVEALYDADGFEIPEDCIVLAGYSDSAAGVASLEVGEGVSWTCHLYTGPYAEEDGVLTDPGEPADDVVTAVNGFHLLARDGVKNENMLSNANEGINSRTVIGITETGIVHIFAINKPSANISTDLTTGSNFREICEYMMDELGCVDVLNMDGGGSTEMLARRAGSDRLETVSYPSDGSSRSVSNCLLIVSDAPRSADVGSVVVDSDVKLYAGSAVDFSIRLTDKSGSAMGTEGKTVAWSARYGSVDEAGRYTAPAGPCEDVVTATVDGVSGSADVSVVDASGIASITAGDTGTVALMQGDVHQFGFAACDADSREIVIDPALAQWSMEGDDIGSLENGLLTVTAERGEATVRARFNGQTYATSVIVGLEEQILDDFETFPIQGYYMSGPMYSGGVGTQHGAKSDMLALETGDRVKNGAHSFRWTYDTANWAWDAGNNKRTSNGTMNFIPKWDDASDYAGDGVWNAEWQAQQWQNYTARAMPRKFGLWVYGDNSGSMMTAVFYTGCTAPGVSSGSLSLNLTGSINWTGWKWLEVEVPQDAQMPIVFNYLWASNTDRTLTPEENYRSDLLIDDLKFIYTDMERDLAGPEFSGTVPAAGGLYSDTLNFSTTVRDAMSRVDPETISVTLDGEAVEDYSYDAETGLLTVTRSGLSDGRTYRLVVRARDVLGNEAMPYIDNAYTVDLTPDTTGPVISDVTPTAAVAVQIPRPRVSFNLQDEKGRVDPDSISVTLDGRAVDVYYDAATGDAYAQPDFSLTDGSAELVIAAGDTAGNAMEPYRDTLTVSLMAQPEDPDHYVIDVIPDTQGNTYSERIYGRAAGSESELVIQLGDIVDGASREEYALAKGYMDSLGKPGVVLAGNHEGVNGNLDLYYETFGSPTYAFSYGSAFFVVLNSAYGQSVQGTDSTQYHWLEEVLADNTLPNVYVLNHVVTRDDFYTEHNMSAAEAERFEGILTDYKAENPEVQVSVIFGHLHTLHSWETGGVRYIIGGNAADKGYVTNDQGNLLGSGRIVMQDGVASYEYIPLLTEIYLKNAALNSGRLQAAVGAQIPMELYGDFREYPANYMTKLSDDTLIAADWSVSDARVASVDGSGLVSVLQEGETAVTASCGGKSVSVTVCAAPLETAALTALTLALPEPLYRGDRFYPTVTAADVNGNRVVLDTAILTGASANGCVVMENGEMRAVGTGRDTVTVTLLTEDGRTLTASAQVQISERSGGGGSGGVQRPASEAGKALPFEDVAGESWYYGSVAYVYENGLFQGTSKTRFSPEAPMTRAMLWTVLARMEGEAPADWAEARGWAVEQGVSDGTDPGAPVTREQLAVMLYRCAGSPSPEAAARAVFSDEPAVSAWAEDAVQWASAQGILQGRTDGRLDPRGAVTRAEAAAMLQRQASA